MDEKVSGLNPTKTSLSMIMRKARYGDYEKQMRWAENKRCEHGVVHTCLACEEQSTNKGGSNGDTK